MCSTKYTEYILVTNARVNVKVLLIMTASRTHTVSVKYFTFVIRRTLSLYRSMNGTIKNYSFWKYAWIDTYVREWRNEKKRLILKIYARPYRLSTHTNAYNNYYLLYIWNQILIIFVACSKRELHGGSESVNENSYKTLHALARAVQNIYSKHKQKT